MDLAHTVKLLNVYCFLFKVTTENSLYLTHVVCVGFIFNVAVHIFFPTLGSILVAIHNHDETLTLLGKFVLFLW